MNTKLCDNDIVTDTQLMHDLRASVSKAQDGMTLMLDTLTALTEQGKVDWTVTHECGGSSEFILLFAATCRVGSTTYHVEHTKRDGWAIAAMLHHSSSDQDSRVAWQFQSANGAENPVEKLANLIKKA